jgi:hypothetical protein
MSIPQKRGPAPPHRWYHKICRMCSGGELLIIGIVGTENEHLRKMGIALHASRTNRASGVNSIAAMFMKICTG